MSAGGSDSSVECCVAVCRTSDRSGTRVSDIYVHHQASSATRERARAGMIAGMEASGEAAEGTPM